MKKKIYIPMTLLGMLMSAAVVAKPVSLEALYHDTLNNNPQLAYSQLETQRAAEQKTQASALYQPQIDASVSYGALRNDWTTLTETDGQGAEAKLSVGQNLFSQELNEANKLAEHQVALSSVTHQVAIEGLTLQVANRYFSALRMQEALKQTEATFNAIAEHLKQTQHRFNNGLIAENDVKETQAQYDLAKAAVIFAQNDVEKALDDLYALSGKSYTGVQPFDLSAVEANTPTPAGFSSWEEKAQTHSPQMRVQQHVISLSKAQISLAEAGHLPTLGLLAEYRYAFGAKSRIKPMVGDAGAWGDLDNNATTFAGVAMTLPLYRGGATNSKVEQAKVQYQQALELREQTWRDVTRDVRSTEKNLSALSSANRAYQQAVISAEAALAATEQGFDIGSRTIVDVLNATHQLYAARQQQSEAEINYLLAALNLKFLGGELSEHDITAINSLSLRGEG
ncbi:TolC family outer membrane protein [Enterovibrio calviensis]|uniref:TolC family outer membrane protein n=1 Tax=Enterovibrio calviensis TaxID=91359 RepID=UPI00047F65E1|nr:TolC family outer membrane protein [Enterovibrio calviensis]